MLFIVRDYSQLTHLTVSHILCSLRLYCFPATLPFQVIFSLPICIPAFLTFGIMAFLSFPLM